MFKFSRNLIINNDKRSYSSFIQPSSSLSHYYLSSLTTNKSSSSTVVSITTTTTTNTVNPNGINRFINIRSFSNTPIAALKVLSLKRAGLLDRKRAIDTTMRKSALKKEIKEIENGAFNVPEGISQDFYLAERQFEMDVVEEVKSIKDIGSIVNLIKSEADANYFMNQYRSIQLGLKKPIVLEEQLTLLIYTQLQSVNATVTIEAMWEYFDSFFLTPTFDQFIGLMKIQTDKGIFEIPRGVNADLFYNVQALKWEMARDRKTANDITDLVHLAKTSTDCQFITDELPGIFLLRSSLQWSAKQSLPKLVQRFQELDAHSVVSQMLSNPANFQIPPSSELLETLLAHYKFKANDKKQPSEIRLASLKLMDEIFVTYLRFDLLPPLKVFMDIITTGLGLGTKEGTLVARSKTKECLSLGLSLPTEILSGWIWNAIRNNQIQDAERYYRQIKTNIEEKRVNGNDTMILSPHLLSLGMLIKAKNGNLDAALTEMERIVDLEKRFKQFDMTIVDIPGSEQWASMDVIMQDMTSLVFGTTNSQYISKLKQLIKTSSDVEGFGSSTQLQEVL